MRVLIVDDEPPARERLRQLIGDISGYEVVGDAANGEQAVAIATELAPDIVLLDIRMPGISGVELQRRIAGTQHELPVVVITGHGDDEMKKRALAAGAIAFLDKPFDDDVLLDAIEQAIESGKGTK